ncbi:TIGR00270 family protein [Candidatus Woesearchaeota archaeon]|nr:TIGR00270 family protein [Candidatus Woesearchaeota archaeon]
MIRINCDLCGKTAESLAKAIIEGVQLDVCADCAKFGKVIATVKRPSAKEQHKQYIKQQQAKGEKIELLVEDYAEIIKKKRESMGLTQKDFAGRINEKEIVIRKIETGILNPPLPLVKKLEKFLGISLIEQHEERFESQRKDKNGGFTLGDFIKLKK